MAEQITFPPNVTGFHSPSQPAPALRDLQDFHAKCQAVSALSMLEMVSFHDYSDEPNRSYHLQLAKDSRSIGYIIFVNKYAPLIAFAKIMASDWEGWNGSGNLPTNEYTDWQELADIFQPDFQTIPVKTLLLPIDADQPESAAVVQNLQDAEFAELSYFAPQNMGNLVFNNWKKR